MLRRYFRARFVVAPFDLADVQAVALLVNVHDAEAPLAARGDAEQPIVQLFEIDDARERADRPRSCAAPPASRPATISATPKPMSSRMQRLDHVDVARFENAQPAAARPETARCSAETAEWSRGSR